MARNEAMTLKGSLVMLVMVWGVASLLAANFLFSLVEPVVSPILSDWLKSVLPASWVL